MKLFKRVLVEMLVISSVVVCSLTFINKDIIIYFKYIVGIFNLLDVIGI